jgi:hypothetical protein
MKSTSPTLIGLFIFLATVTARADDLDLIPARFSTGDQSINSLLQCPDKPRDKDMVSVTCQARIDEEGSASDFSTVCFGTGSRKSPYAEAVLEAVRESLFLPATRNSEPVIVKFLFRVFLSYTEGQCTPIKIPNLGHQTDEFTTNYIAPQEILENQGWQLRARGLGPETDSAVSSSGMMMQISAMIAENGTPDKVRLEHNNFASRREIRTFISAMEKSEIIPGFFEGAPHKMRFHDFYYLRTQ